MEGATALRRSMEDNPGVASLVKVVEVDRGLTVRVVEEDETCIFSLAEAAAAAAVAAAAAAARHSFHLITML